MFEWLKHLLRPIPDNKATFATIKHKIRRHFFDKALELAEPGDTVVLRCLDQVNTFNFGYDDTFYVYGLKKIEKGRIDFYLGFISWGAIVIAPKPFCGMSIDNLFNSEYLVFMSQVDLPRDADPSVIKLLQERNILDELDEEVVDIV